MNVFCLNCHNYSIRRDMLFLAPEGACMQSFKKLCDRLLPLAALNLIEFKGHPADMRKCLDEHMSIYGEDIVEEVGNMLADYGYVRYKPYKVEYFVDGFYPWNQNNKLCKPFREVLGKEVVSKLEEYHKTILIFFCLKNYIIVFLRIRKSLYPRLKREVCCS